ncbi:hypothetical protein OCU04_010359 [Sclerotinia nivalis]|uniref:Uncharacterized protein n=1 Tax=Sclerotinia nivalis TaxID=352851 RepID=A0A9X0AED2_9HELO|nr:hypothetical protein OCU04_010359 [Sclerotinia nivalis]
MDTTPIYSPFCKEVVVHKGVQFNYDVEFKFHHVELHQDEYLIILKDVLSRDNRQKLEQFLEENSDISHVRGGDSPVIVQVREGDPVQVREYFGDEFLEKLKLFIIEYESKSRVETYPPSHVSPTNSFGRSASQVEVSSFSTLVETSLEDDNRRHEEVRSRLLNSTTAGMNLLKRSGFLRGNDVETDRLERYEQPWNKGKPTRADRALNRDSRR